MDEKPAKKRHKMVTETLVEHLHQAYFDKSVLSTTDINNYITSHPKLSKAWESCRITFITHCLSKRFDQVASWKSYKDEIYNFLLYFIRRQKIEGKSDLINIVFEKNSSLHFFKKFVQYYKKQESDIKETDKESENEDEIKICDFGEDDNIIIKDEISIIAVNKQFAKFKLGLAKKATTRSLELLELCKQPKKLVLELIKNHPEFV